MGRAYGENGRRSPDKERRCIPRGRQEEKRETAVEVGGLREKRRQERGSRSKLEEEAHDGRERRNIFQKATDKL